MLNVVRRRHSDVTRRVSLLPYEDVFVCRTCLGQNCTVKEKVEVEFKIGEDVLEEVKKLVI